MAADLIGRQVGNYQLLNQVAEDGLGLLYGGRHIGAGWPATLRHFLAPLSDVPLIQRYFAAAQRAAQLGHPGILRVVESFWSGRNAFVASEPVLGESLETVLRRDRKLWPELCVKLSWQFAMTLGTAHANNIVHGVLRPESIYCWPDPEVPGGYRTRIIDFGASAFLDVGTPDWRSQRVECLGLPLYMAPEQGRMGVCDYRVDVYALGCVMFQLACGRTPFLGGSPFDLVQAHATTQVRGPGSYDNQIPFELDALIQAMIAKDPAQRPVMPQVAQELHRIGEKYWPAPIAPSTTVQLDLKVGTPPPAVVSGAKKSRSLVPFLIGGVVLAGGATLVALHPWSARQADAAVAVVAVVPDAAAAKAAVAVVTPDAAPAPAPAPPPEPSPAEQKLAEARKALAEARWADAATAAKAFAKLDPTNPEAAKIAKTAAAEPANQALYDDFEKSLKDPDDVATAVRRFHRLPADSFYTKKAQPDYDKLKGDFMHVQIAQAKALAETSKCAKLPPIEKQVTALFPEAAGDVQAIEKGCR